MASNLLVFYRCADAATHGTAVYSAIKALGPAVRLLHTCWYVRSTLPAPDAARGIWHVMASKDSLVVVDATEGEAAWRNVEPQAAEFIKEQWSDHKIGRLLGSTSLRSTVRKDSGPPWRPPSRRPAAGFVN